MEMYVLKSQLEIDYRIRFSVISLSLDENTGTVPKVKPRLIHSTHFPIY
jgi:hypothetical protein